MYSVLKFAAMGDDNGRLVALEGNVHIPFDICRVFYISGIKPGVVRGAHANRKSQFVMVCVTGSCKVKVCHPKETLEVVLDSPTKGLYLDNMVWKEMYDFSPDAVLMVLSNEPYDKDEYIYDYDAYVEECHAAV